MNESEFQDRTIQLAHACGWRVAHFRPAKTDRGWRTPVSADGAGFPDLVLVKGLDDGHGVYLIVEMKSEKGKLSAHQDVWLSLLANVEGVFSGVWKPSHSDVIEQVLQAKGLSDIIVAWRRFV